MNYTRMTMEASIMWRSSLLVLASALVINAASPSSVEAKISDPRKVALVAALVAGITGTYGGYYHIVGADGEREARGIVAQMDDAHAAAAVLKAVQISVASAATDQIANPEVVVSTALNVLQALEPKLSAETGDARGGANRNGGRSSRPGTPEYPGIGHIRSTLTEVLAIGPGPLKHEEIGAALAQAERSPPMAHGFGYLVAVIDWSAVAS
ncbi:MAG: hypothetical protein IPG96_21440 [Proteobacteria bacterium]|nr:hypothetical protein [Pseudomonadota bacterium]